MRDDYLDLLEEADKNAVCAFRQRFQRMISRPRKGYLRYLEPLRAVQGLPSARFTDYAGDVVRIGRADELTPYQHQALEEAMRAFMPWRKGPFDFFGLEIDAEWQSFRKWNRLLPKLPDLTGKTVADIGCNNGYYMFRMLPHAPRLVVGFEPMLQHYFCFKALHHLAGYPPTLAIEPMGVEEITLFCGCFDVVFLMGVIYHRISPVAMLKEVRSAMRKGGVLIVESQGIPGDDPVALFPEERYAKAPGVYFVPTARCLVNWLKRAGFADVDLFCTHPMSSEEQRRTEWMTFESYSDFIDQEHPDRTVEGYPAPIRIFAKALNP